MRRGKSAAGRERLCSLVTLTVLLSEPPSLSLHQVVWHSMQDEFIRQYKHFEGLIGRCYPGSGITMEFTIQDMLEYFSSIAQSH